MKTLAASFIAGAIVMLLLAVWMFKHSKEKRLRERMMHHFRQVLPYGSTVSGSTPAAEQTYWHLFKVRASIYAGFELQKKASVCYPAGLHVHRLGGLAHLWPGGRQPAF